MVMNGDLRVVLVTPLAERLLGFDVPFGRALVQSAGSRERAVNALGISRVTLWRRMTVLERVQPAESWLVRRRRLFSGHRRKLPRGSHEAGSCRAGSWCGVP